MRRLLRSLLAVAMLLGSWPVTSAGSGVVKNWNSFDESDGLPSNKVFAVLVDGPRVWVGTEAGLALFDKKTRRVAKVYDTSNGLPYSTITALARNPDNGDLWIGTMGGVARLSGGRVDVFTQLNSGLANNVVYGIAADGNEIWVATAAGLSRYHPRTGSWEIFDTTNTLMHEPWCYGVTVDRGTVYVAVWGSGVIVRDARTGKFRVHRDPDGEMEIDLFRDDGLVHDVTSAISVDGNVMWVGTYFGLSRYDGRRWQSYSAQDSGIAGDFINFVKADSGAVWIATDQGLSRFDGKIWNTWRRSEKTERFELSVTGPDGTTSTKEQSTGPASNTIYGIDLDREGVWLATARGLTHGSRPSANVAKGDQR